MNVMSGRLPTLSPHPIRTKKQRCYFRCRRTGPLWARMGHFWRKSESSKQPRCRERERTLRTRVPRRSSNWGQRQLLRLLRRILRESRRSASTHLRLRQPEPEMRGCAPSIGEPLGPSWRLGGCRSGLEHKQARRRCIFCCFLRWKDLRR